jgi:hypothetical protein
MLGFNNKPDASRVVSLFSTTQFKARHKLKTLLLQLLLLPLGMLSRFVVVVVVAVANSWQSMHAQWC